MLRAASVLALVVAAAAQTGGRGGRGGDPAHTRPPLPVRPFPRAPHAPASPSGEIDAGNPLTHSRLPPLPSAQTHTITFQQYSTAHCEDGCVAYAARRCLPPLCINHAHSCVVV
jgi:hypothetical protein